MATLEDLTSEETHCFLLNKRMESIGVVFTVSLRNINQLTVSSRREEVLVRQ